MNTSAPDKALPLQSIFSSGIAALAALILLTGASSVFAQPKTAAPGTITSISQTITTVAGVPTLLTASGTGNCKFRLSYSKLDAPQAAQPVLTYSSTAQSPFPMNLRVFDATPVGTYTWSVMGIEGCIGNSSVTVKVQ